MSKTEKQIGATARIRFTVDFPARSTWGSGCAVQQVFDQAGEEAYNAMEKLLKEHGGQIVGEPEVVAVMTKR